ncbi:MAG: RNA methyltransferase [Anaerolineales bacterium]
MPPHTYSMRECLNPACGLRYPLIEGHPFGERCPLCLGPTRAALTQPIHPEAVAPPNWPEQRLEALLDNVRSAWNVGSIFRTADGLGIRRLHLCGITPTPHNKDVRKTALGAEESVDWSHHRNALHAARDLIEQGAALWALEQDARSVALGETHGGAVVETDKRIVLIVGNEVTGVDPALLDLCERIVHIPMYGSKRSLNVEVAFGIAAWALLHLSRTTSRDPR